MPSIVPNEFPSVTMPYRLAIIGEAPGPHEAAQAKPFVGPTGGLITSALASAKTMRSACFLGYICSHETDRGYVDGMDFQGYEIRTSLERLRLDLSRFNPNCVLLMGKGPLQAAGQFQTPFVYRGTIFKGLFDYKCVSTLHPDYVMKVWEDSPLFEFDVKRAKEESFSPDLVLPQRRLQVSLSPPEILSKLNALTACKIAIDIEGGIPDESAAKVEYKHRNGITCISIATSPDYAFIIPFEAYDDDTKRIMLLALARVMADPSIEKILQNGMYDYVVMAWHWKMPIVNMSHDTMLSGWEIFPELPKGLGTQASIWTREPYYKSDRLVPDRTTHYTYCCKDSAVTYEIHNAHMAAMTDSQKSHYTFNTELLPSLQFMSLRGINYDKKESDFYHSQIKSRMLEIQLACNTHAGMEINLNSPKQMCDLLYKKFRLEPQYAIEKGRKTNRLTADGDALLHGFIKSQHPFLSCALAWKKLEGERKQLEIVLDHDGRVRCSYNLVGAETGRLTCSGSNTGSGTNLQTIIKHLRKYYIADPGYHFFQCDLEGADGWTVAAHCADLGDPTMLEDYYFGLKPAKLIALMRQLGPEITHLSRAELKALLKSTPIPDDTYAVCKVVQHGSNYGMGANRMSEQVLEKSFKKSADGKIILVPPRECTAIQNLYFKRYPGVIRWQESIVRQLRDSRSLPSASGHTRCFFGRPHDKQTHKSAYSHEPQANTTYATNLAMHKLWFDRSNRRADRTLFIEPLHSVHDALCGQFPVDSTEQAVESIRGYFDNTIRIGSVHIKIPFEGGYGPSWYHTDEAHRLGVI